MTTPWVESDIVPGLKVTHNGVTNTVQFMENEVCYCVKYCGDEYAGNFQMPAADVCAELNRVGVKKPLLDGAVHNEFPRGGE